MRIGTLVWPVAPPRPSMLVVVKATYDLRPEGTATLAKEQLLPTGDLFVDDDPTRPGVYSSDFALLKPRGECFFVGSCHAPRPDMGMVPVAFQVGELRKSLVVFGERRWSMRLPGQPAPFTSLPLTWEFAFGGGADARNPAGMGLGADTDGVHRPPRVEDPARLIGAPDQRPTPAGTGPLMITHPSRQRLAGTYDRRWQATRWPWLPEDCHPEFFMAAPPDQRRDGYWHGDEAILMQNLTQGRPVVRSRLPGLTPRAFLRRASVTDRPVTTDVLEEIPLRLDTITLLGDQGETGRVVCIWRGRCDIADDEASDVADLFLLHEEPSRRREGPEVVHAFEAALAGLRQDDEAAEPVPVPETEPLSLEAEPPPLPAAPPAPPLPTPPDGLPEGPDGAPLTDPSALEALYLSAGVPMPPEVAGFVADTRRALDDGAEAGEAPGAHARTTANPGRQRRLPPRDTPRLDARPLIEQAHAGALELAGADLAGADLPGANLSGLDLSGAILTDADLADADLRGTNLAGAILTGARFQDARLAGADLSGAELSETDLRGADATEANLSGVTGELTVFADAKLPRATLTEALLAEVDLSGADLSGADLSGADLTDGRLVGARMTGATLAEASVEGADLSRAHLSSADLTELRASGARLEGADLSRAHAAGAQLGGAVLDRANLAFSILDGGDLSHASFAGARLDGASLVGVRLQHADLSAASLIKANLFESNLEAADLRGADLRGANLFSAQLWKADVSGARLELANLDRTHLGGRR